MPPRTADTCHIDTLRNKETISSTCSFSILVAADTEIGLWETYVLYVNRALVWLSHFLSFNPTHDVKPFRLFA